MKVDPVDVIVPPVRVQKTDEVRNEGLAVAQIRGIVRSAAHRSEHDNAGVFRFHGVIEFDVAFDVVLRIERAPSLPVPLHFIADLPIANPVPFHEVCVVDPRGRFLRRARAHIDRDDGLGGRRERLQVGHERLEVEVGLRDALAGWIGAGCSRG